MSEELVILQEYFESLGLSQKILTTKDLELLRNELEDAGESSLADWVGNLSSPEELLDYIGE